MSTEYPDGIDDATNLPTAADLADDDLDTKPHSTVHGNAHDAIIAIEGELGTNPKGVHASVKARLDAVDTTAGTKQPLDATLTALAGLATGTDKLGYWTAVDTVATTDFTAFARTLLDDADNTAARSTLGLVIGTDVQRQDPELAALAGLTSAADKLPYFTGSGTAALADLSAFMRTVLDDSTAGAARQTLGVAIGSDVQAFDADLAALAGVTSAADKVPYFTGSGTATVADLTALGRSRVGGNRTTRGDADYVILTTDRQVVLTAALTSPRTWTLPVANSVTAGTELHIADEANGVGTTNHLTMQTTGSDTIVNPVEPNRTNLVRLRQTGDTMVFRSDGTSKWSVRVGENKPAAWWTHDNPVAIPNNVWTPIPWGNLATDPYLLAGVTTPTATTTIAAGSNGHTLSTATINVTDASSFDTAGWLAITGPPGTGIDTVVHYTGKTATSFTGCNSSPNANIATGTLATGQTVTQVVVDWVFPNSYFAQIAEVAWGKSGTGVRGIRNRAIDGVFNLAGATAHWPALDITNQHTQVTMQPGNANNGTARVRIEAFQTSGAALQVTADGIQSPSIMQVYVCGQALGSS